MSLDISTPKMLWHVVTFAIILILFVACVLLADFAAQTRRRNLLYEEKIPALQQQLAASQILLASCVAGQIAAAQNHAHNRAIEQAAKLCDDRLGQKNPASAAIRAFRVRAKRQDRPGNQLCTIDQHPSHHHLPGILPSQSNLGETYVV